MTQSTEQERAHALAEKHGATSYRNRADTSNPAFGFTLGQLEALISEVEQAARRAPVVPMPNDVTALVAAAQALVLDPTSHVKKLQLEAHAWGPLAAAPQPPEACTCPSGDGSLRWPCPKHPPEAAPVQLPENVYTLRIRGRLHDYTPALPAFDLEDGEHKLYTEQQVRQLLAAQARKG